ncbi:MAG: ribosomal L7Ae/L30e/S12e/Gadd45 family protein [Blautia sp.]|nr:ribosomal L7Ae/L30e/S12e/Gadd45 family protein [Blautia sp.]
MESDRALSMLGLAARAGKTPSGEFAVEKSIRSGKARLVLLAADSSENTRKKFTQMCEFARIPLLLYSDKEKLGAAIGKDLRSSVAIEDENLALAVQRKISMS